MLHALITFAATEEGEESSKTLFYVFGGLLAVWEKPPAATASMTFTRFGAPPHEARWRDWWG